MSDQTVTAPSFSPDAIREIAETYRATHDLSAAADASLSGTVLAAIEGADYAVGRIHHLAELAEATEAQRLSGQQIGPVAQRLVEAREALAEFDAEQPSLFDELDPEVENAAFFIGEASASGEETPVAYLDSLLRQVTLARSVLANPDHQVDRGMIQDILGLEWADDKALQPLDKLLVNAHLGDPRAAVSIAALNTIVDEMECGDRDQLMYRYPFFTERVLTLVPNPRALALRARVIEILNDDDGQFFLLIGEPTNGAPGFLAAAEAVLAEAEEAQRRSGKQIGPVAAAEQPSLLDELDLPIPYSLVEPEPDPEDEDEDDAPSIPESEVVDMFEGVPLPDTPEYHEQQESIRQRDRLRSLVAALAIPPSIAAADVVDMFAGVPLPSLGWS